jgi:alkylation response protein AidB-like acyl-CoA dehydrogenase
MDFALTEDQQLLMTAFEGLLERYRDAPQGVHGYVAWSPQFQQELRDGGFNEIATPPGFGLLEAAMLVEAAAACPVGVEAAATMMIGPLVGDTQGPVAIAWQCGKPVRYLDEASNVCLIGPDAVLVGNASQAQTEPAGGVVAYPMATLRAPPSDSRRITGNEAATIRRRALIGLAAEAAGLMRGALDLTVAYVKERQQFGQPLGNFQAIQHRLAECAQIVGASRLLAFRAADRDGDRDGDQLAALACLYVQEQMRKVITDCHQFCGAMGLTLEFPLHLWTYRLKVLQGEAGGRAAQAERVAESKWASAPARPGTRKQMEEVA